ncbi:MAG: HAMP domain-containing histidine kinase [Anaerolineae bacterium]|jgi:PAS domain-containing protein|nr:HAMP domain-containing histidine kinase [Anaerolineae bacterium]
MAAKLEAQAVLDALGHGILIFSSDGKLIQHNVMAGTLLGTDLKIIREQGWNSAAALFDTDLLPEERVDEIRKKALSAERPVRFHIFRSGEYVPCTAATITDAGGEVALMLTLDVPDWDVVSSVIDKFRVEMRDAVQSTRGHIDLINRTIGSDQDPAAARIIRRIGGFTRLIGIHMSRAGRLMHMLERLEDLRTGKLRDKVRDDRKKLNLEDYLEEFIESLDEIELLDPETEMHDYRSRIKLVVEGTPLVNVSRRYLTYTLQELLRNAIMYSLRGTTIQIKVTPASPGIQMDVTDEGYGIRPREAERVFKPFQRARQPQIISEFGYGLSLYLCKSELAAMNAHLWFTSEDGVGTTFSLMLPPWVEDAAASSSSQPA